MTFAPAGHFVGRKNLKSCHVPKERFVLNHTGINVDVLHVLNITPDLHNAFLQNANLSSSLFYPQSGPSEHMLFEVVPTI